jgi:hypothetical protein
VVNDFTWCETCYDTRPEKHKCWDEYTCRLVNADEWETKVRASCPLVAAERAVEKYDETDPGDITTTVRVDVVGPDGKKIRFTVYGEYSIEYSAHEEDTVE